MIPDRRLAARERRRAARAPLTAAVARRIGAATHLAQASNIGTDGMTLRFPGDSAPVPRAPVALVFELPDGNELIQVRAEVVFDRIEGAYRTAGMRFHGLDPGDARRIERFVAGASSRRRA